jgi:hypothetical protein
MMVIGRSKLIFIIWLGSLILIHLAYPCQYNVREVGFADLDREQYMI